VPDFGREPDLTKLVGASTLKLSKQQLVAKFAEILAEREEEIAALRAELAKLHGSPVTVKAVSGFEADTDFRGYLTKVAARDPSEHHARLPRTRARTVAG
jgi:hypothetical protein